MKKVIKFLITTISKFIYWAYLIKVKLTPEELKAKKKNKNHFNYFELILLILIDAFI